MRIESRFELLGEVRRDAYRRAVEAGFDAEDAADIALCVSEAVANAIQHGNRGDPRKSVQIEFRDSATEFVVEVRDEGSGIPFRVEHGRVQRAPGEPGPGGGVRLMLGLMDRVEFGRSEGRITLIKRKT